MFNTSDLIAIIYLAIGLIIAINFAYAEIKRKNISFALIMAFVIFLIFLWPFYWQFFTTNERL